MSETFEVKYGHRIGIGCYTHKVNILVNTREEMLKFYHEHSKCKVY